MAKPDTPGIFEYTFNLQTTNLFLRAHGLIRSELICRKCGAHKKLKKSNVSSDQEVFACTKCNDSTSIRTGSIFEGSRLTLRDICLIVYFFIQDAQICDLAKYVPTVAHTTAIHWYGKLRDICRRYNDSRKTPMGPEVDSTIIALDDKFFGKKRKLKCGQDEPKQQWIFAIAERGTRNVMMRIIDSKDRDTLLPIIEAYVDKKAKLFIDDWSSYESLQLSGTSPNGSVNDNVEFVSRGNVCTEAVKSLWVDVKGRIARGHGVPRDQISTYLDEFTFRHQYPLNMYSMMFAAIRECYKL